MAKSVKSQWEFGELFPATETRRVLTVSELTGQVKRLLETQFGQVWVSGEISNLRLQASGHCYFTLKDAGAQLNCVLFRGQAKTSRDLLADGRKVMLQGEVTVYEPRGQYQLVVTTVEIQGLGALQLAFERLKQKLHAEGLFEPARKRPLPRFPQRIGVVTSPTGVALRDVVHVVQRRQPGLELVLVPCRVQGQGAAEEIAAAIRRLNAYHAQFHPSRALPQRADAEHASEVAGASAGSGLGLDLILVTRGGGSLEDLWAFNEEVVARAIFDSALPVISAVGHEIDFTISDFVADVRAATPSAAAEIITEGAFASREFLLEARGRMGQLVRQRWTRGGDGLAQVAGRLQRLHPRRRLNDHWQRLDEVQGGLVRAARVGLRDAAGRALALRGRWVRVKPGMVLARRQESLRQAGRRLQELARLRSQESRRRLATLEARLRLLSPLNVLARGYSITRDAETGQVIRQLGQTRPGQRLQTRLRDGEVPSVVSP